MVATLTDYAEVFCARIHIFFLKAGMKKRAL